jgi:hypothetical protein
METRTGKEVEVDCTNTVIVRSNWYELGWEVLRHSITSQTPSQLDLKISESDFHSVN